jgi:hypothetical protein
MDTANPNLIYLALGYTVFLGGIALYALSLWVRRRNLSRDEQRLERVEKQLAEEARAPQAGPPRASP